MGSYPECSCPEPLKFNKDRNMCLECPKNVSTGIYPNCTCKNGLFSQYYGTCIECPENSTGI